MEAMGADDCWDFTNDLVDSDNDDNDDVSWNTSNSAS